MTSPFWVYLRLGFDHIIDWSAYDHLLFVVALVAIYLPRQWKHLLVLVTAFTVGHSVTLALATLRIVSIDTALVETLIPVTILLTAAANAVELRLERRPDGARGLRHRWTWRAKYALALIFGLIHGLGFSNFLRSLLGEEESILIPLFSFNVGLEVGQLLILTATLAVSAAVTRLTPITQPVWAILLSTLTGAWALTMIL